MVTEKINLCVEAKLTVVPSKAVTRGKVHPLSNLDNMMQLHRLRIVYYYRKCRHMNILDFIENLKESLSQTLSEYPTISGRLQVGDFGNWKIKCNDAGVRVLEAKVNTSLDQWLETVDRSAELKLTYSEDIGSDPTSSSLASVQLTEFEGGGLAIGLSCAHMVADPRCATLFMKSWGEIHRSLQKALHSPGWKTTRPQLTADHSAAIESQKSTFESLLDVGSHGQEVYETVTFKFSHEMVKQCISEVQKGEHGGHYGEIKAFEALSALFWICYTRARENLNIGESTLSICSEFMRNSLTMAPHGYNFGNTLHFSGISSRVKDLKSKDLSYTAHMIHEHLSQIERDHEIKSIMEEPKMKIKEDKGSLPPFLVYGPQLTCANWENFCSYDAVFEEDKPIHVSYHIEPVYGEGQVLVLPSTEGNLSRTVMATLPKSQMAKVCQDPLLLHFSPTFLTKTCV